MSNKPKAIFLAGSAGGGKSSTYKTDPTNPTQLDNLLPNSFSVINIDDSYEDLLKKSGLGTTQTSFNPEELSQAAKLMGQAQKATKEKYATLSSQRKNLIIDGTGASIKPLLKRKQELEDLGYDTFMIIIWVSPVTSLKRNTTRPRALLPQIVLRTWRDVNKNIDDYRNIFGNKFVIINNNPEKAETGYNVEDIKKRFFDTISAKGKEKTPEEMKKSKMEKEQLNNDIVELVKTIPEFNTIDQAKSKINIFIK